MRTIIELHFMGGPPFMFVLSSLFLIILILATYSAILLLFRKNSKTTILKNTILGIIYLGVFALVWGFLGQGIGIYQALWAIQQAADISPAIIMGGIRVSLITPLYGMIILLIASLIWYFLKVKYNTIITTER